MLSTLTEAGWANRTISQADAQQLLGGQSLEPSPWDRFSLIGGVVLLIVVVVLVNATKS